MYSINCASIDSPLLWFDHEVHVPTVDTQPRSVMIVRPRNEWAYAWYVWNRRLRIKNVNRTTAKPMVDLGNEDDTVKVRSEIIQCIKNQGISAHIPECK